MYVSASHQLCGVCVAAVASVGNSKLVVDVGGLVVNTLCPIYVGALRWVWLVPGWQTVSGQVDPVYSLDLTSSHHLRYAISASCWIPNYRLDHTSAS